MTGPDLEHLLRPATGGVGFEVFAVEDTTAQLSWSYLPAGTHCVRVDGSCAQRIEVPGTDGPGSLLLEDLTPDSRLQVTLDMTRGVLRRPLRTLAAPPGEQLFRFATINDLHLGRGDRQHRGPLAHHGVEGSGHAGTRTSAQARTQLPDRPLPDRPMHCARAAIDDALAWGAELLIVKGDVCEETTEATWDQAAELLGDLPVPVMILPGNHDTGRLREFAPEVGAARRGLTVTRGVDHADVPGIRILLVDSTIDGNGWGAVSRHAAAVADVAGDAPGGVFVATHHHAQRFAVPLFWPHGIPGPDARRFARSLRAANPNALVSSGHTHRCRARDVGGVRWTEVAATNHFPTVWAGYAVHEGGVRQVVRRTTAPDVVAWSEQTRHALGGIWALWSTGNMSDRCFSLDWR